MYTTRFRVQEQRADMWCWAAVVVGMLEPRGSSIQQCDVVEMTLHAGHPPCTGYIPYTHRLPAPLPDALRAVVRPEPVGVHQLLGVLPFGIVLAVEHALLGHRPPGAQVSLGTTSLDHAVLLAGVGEAPDGAVVVMVADPARLWSDVEVRPDAAGGYRGGATWNHLVWTV
jgi:hypothetical protein